MGVLKDLFDRLNDLEYCKYSKDGMYPVNEGERIIELRCKELLEVGRSYPTKEHVMVAYFGTAPTRILYFGENANSMKKTLDDLRLPNSWPSNLGEKVFYLFKCNLENANFGPISLEQQVVSGKEHQFELVLKKLINIYRTSEKTSAA